MSVPEASIHEDARPVFPQNQVWMSWQSLVVQSETESPFPQPTTHNHLRLRVFRPNRRHILMTLFCGEFVHLLAFWQLNMVLLAIRQNWLLTLFISLFGLFLYPDTGIDGDDAVLVGEQWVDVHLLDFGGKAEQGREAYDNLGIFLLVDTLLPSRTFYYFIAS